MSMPPAKWTTAVNAEAIAVRILLTLLGGSTFCNAIRRNGKPCRIQLPDDPKARSELVRAHVSGEPSILEFHAEGSSPWMERVDAVDLAALCPDTSGRCRWLGIDLDASDHGDGGLVDPVHAMRCLAERADMFGLAGGLLAARSRRGQGRHVLLVLSEPISLPDAVIGVAVLAAAGLKIAASDAMEHGGPQAFRVANGLSARPGNAGAVELLPRSTARPPYGWALALPGAGAQRSHGGGIIVDPFDDTPIIHDCVPNCDPIAWRVFVTEYRHFLSRIDRGSSRPHQYRAERSGSHQLHPLTLEYLAGQTPTGRRNTSAFAAACNLLGHGLPLHEVERQILHGARRCELPEREARSAVKSALRTVEQG